MLLRHAVKQGKRSILHYMGAWGTMQASNNISFDDGCNCTTSLSFVSHLHAVCPLFGGGRVGNLKYNKPSFGF